MWAERRVLLTVNKCSSQDSVSTWLLHLVWTTGSEVIMWAQLRCHRQTVCVCVCVFHIKQWKAMPMTAAAARSGSKIEKIKHFHSHSWWPKKNRFGQGHCMVASLGQTATLRDENTAANVEVWRTAVPRMSTWGSLQKRVPIEKPLTNYRRNKHAHIKKFIVNFLLSFFFNN